MIVADTKTLEPVKTFVFRDHVRPIELNEDETRLYVQLSRFYGLVEFDLETETVLREVSPNEPEGGAVVEPHWAYTVDHGLRRSPDGTKLVSVLTTSNSVAIYSLPDLKVLKIIEVGENPSFTKCSKVDKDICYVTNRLTRDISVISLSELKEIDRVHVPGVKPQRIDITLPEKCSK